MRDANGKQLGVYPLEEVMSNINTLKGLITPDAFHLVFRGEIWNNAGDNQNYLGVFVTGFLLLRLIRVLRDRSLRQERTLLLIAITCFIAAMGQIHFLGVTIPSLREILRYLMPGMRQFSRFGLIAQGIFVVLAWREVDNLLRNLRNQRLQKVSLFVIGALILLDLNPMSRRIVYDPPLKYQAINTILTNSPDPLVLIAQNSEPDPGIFDSKIVVNKLGIYAGLAGGLQEFTASLNAQKVTHIISDVAENSRSQFSAYIQDSIRMNLELPSNSFVPVSKSVLVEERDYFDGPIDVTTWFVW
jgi:hypothetical protein